MSVDLTSLLSLSAAQPVASFLLGLVAQRRTVRFDELVRLARQARPSPEREDIKRALESLKDLNVVGESKSSIEDFNTLYITADGLEVSRRMPQLGKTA